MARHQLFFAEAGARGPTIFAYRKADAPVARAGAIDLAVIGAGVTVCP